MHIQIWTPTRIINYHITLNNVEKEDDGVIHRGSYHLCSMNKEKKLPQPNKVYQGKLVDQAENKE